MHPPKSYLTTLTPLRGIAALLVVIFHCNLMVAAFLPPGYTFLISNGWLWVDFFFILSGFIMAYVYGQEFKNGIVKSAYWKYIGARFARVYPLHLFTLIWALGGCLIILSIADGLDPFFADMLNPMAAPASLVFLQGMHLYSAAPLNTPSWSLSTEWWMYMLFPFLVPIFCRLNAMTKGIAAFLIVVFYLLIMYYLGPISGPFGGGPPTINLVADFGFPRCALGFLLGLLIYELYVSGTAYRLLKSDITFILLFFGCLLAMHFDIHQLLMLSFFPFIILAAAHNASSVKRVLDTKPLQLLGEWSFSIYMVHVPIIYFFWIKDVSDNPHFFADFLALVSRQPDYGVGLIRLLIIVPATLIVASMTYRYIEIPARKYLNSLFKTKQVVASAAVKA